MERRIKPWVNRKILEYIGDEEPTLSSFICEKVMSHSSPQTILNDIAMVRTYKNMLASVHIAVVTQQNVFFRRFSTKKLRCSSSRCGDS